MTDHPELLGGAVFEDAIVEAAVNGHTGSLRRLSDAPTSVSLETLRTAMTQISGNAAEATRIMPGMNLIRDGGGNADGFVRKFRERLQELRALLKVNDAVEICQFMAAILEAPKAQPLVTQAMLVQHDLIPSMLYNQFQNSMALTRLQNIFTKVPLRLL